MHCRRAALTIPGVGSQHAGEYLFVVRSPRGMAEGAVRLNVTRGASSYSRGWTGNSPSSSSSGVSSRGSSAASVPVRESVSPISGAGLVPSRGSVGPVAEEPSEPHSPSEAEVTAGSSRARVPNPQLLILLTILLVALLSARQIA